MPVCESQPAGCQGAGWGFREPRIVWDFKQQFGQRNLGSPEGTACDPGMKTTEA